MAWSSARVSPTSTTKRLRTIWSETRQRASMMLTPAAALGRDDVGGRGLALGRLALLEALEHLLHDGLGRDLGRAQGDVEVVGLAEAHLADHVGQQRGADHL